MNDQPNFASVAEPAGARQAPGPAADRRTERLGEAAEEGLTLDIRTIWAAIYRNRVLVIMMVLLAIAVGVAVTVFTTPVYEAKASVQIEREATRVLDSDDLQPRGSSDEDRFLQTQIDVLKSRTLSERVAQSLGLFNNNRFLIAMGERVAADEGVAPGANAARRKDVVSLLQSNLTVDVGRDSNLAVIGFKSTDPATAARVANSIAENFIVGNLRRKYEASSYARNFLRDQLADVKARLEESERASIGYARSARLIDASNGNAGSGAGATAGGTQGTSLVTSSLVQINNALSAALAARLAAEQRWRQAQATPLMSLTDVQASATIQNLVRQRAELAAQYEEQRQRRKSDFPEMIQAQARIKSLDAQIKSLAIQVRQALLDQFEVAQKQEAALRSNLDRLTGDTLAEQDRSIRFNILRREVDTNRTLYDGLLQRYKEVSAAAGVATNNISIVDVAEVPGVPILPRPFLNLALAVLAGIALALLTVLARETLGDVIRLPEDVERRLTVPFLGTVPALRSDETPSSAFEDKRSAFSEAYYSVRSALEFSTASGVPDSLLCTSSVPSEGKSTTSVSLAKSFARTGRKVLLIDGDLRKPSLHHQLGLRSDVGFTNVLTRQQPPEAVVQETDTPNLTFMACGPLPPNPGELLATAKLDALLARLRETYSLVLIDGPPVMGLADAPLLASMTSGTVFVIEANRAHRAQAKIALRRLRSAHAVIVGAVLTKFNAGAMGYGYDYNYNYSYAYKYGSEAPKARRLFKMPG